MAVAPPFANLLSGMTKLRIAKPKSHPVHRGQADFGNSGTTILNLKPRISRSGQDYPSERRTPHSKFFVPFILSGRC
jgi:hypothetical protein